MMRFILLLPRQLFFAQCVTGLLLSAIITLFNPHLGFSFFMGALCILIANAALTLRFLMGARALEASKAVRALLSGELFKFLTLALVLIAVYRFFHLNWIAFFLGLILTQFGGFFALIIKRWGPKNG